MKDNRTLDRIALDRELVKRGGLEKMIELAWNIVEPVPYRSNWHIGLICEVLEAAFDREIRKFLINIPPGCSKSRIVSTFYPAWCWTEDPTECFLYASFDQSLSDRDARGMRSVVMSDWYQDRWPEAKLPRAAVRQVREFANYRGGWRFSTTIPRGKGTGKHPHQRIFDDPIKPADTTGGSETTRKALDACLTWYRGTISTRQADPVNTITGGIMQRLHDADLAGHLAAEWKGEPDFVHVVLPMRAELDRKFSFPALKIEDPRSTEGELLWPDRYPEEEVQKLETSLLEYAAAQLQQNPTDRAGGVFKREWFRFWSPGGTIPSTVALPAVGRDLQSWDMAFKGKDSSDPACGGIWRRAGGRFFLLDCEWDRWNFPGLLEAVQRLCHRWPRVYHKLVEDKANGPAVVDSLFERFPGFEEITPKGGKEARAHAAAPLFKTECVYLPHPSLFPWVTKAIEELARFPNAVHDDFVDMTTQALAELYVETPLLPEVIGRLGTVGARLTR